MAALTSTVTVQLPVAGIVPPLKATLPAPVVTLPPQLVFALAGVATTRPAGKLSVSAAPVSATPFVFASVSVSREEAPMPTVAATKLFVSTGLESTVVGSEALLLPALAAGSPPPETLAVLVRLAAALAATLAVSVSGAAVEPTATSALVLQLTAWPLTEQLHPVPLAPTGVSPAGSVSVTFTVPTVLPLPMFVTRSV